MFGIAAKVCKVLYSLPHSAPLCHSQQIPYKIHTDLTYHLSYLTDYLVVTIFVILSFDLKVEKNE